MKFSKIAKVFALAALMSAPFFMDAAYECTVSPKSDENVGHCRDIGLGSSFCYDNGEGPACNGTRVVRSLDDAALFTL